MQRKEKLFFSELCCETINFPRRHKGKTIFCVPLSAEKLVKNRTFQRQGDFCRAKTTPFHVRGVAALFFPQQHTQRKAACSATFATVHFSEWQSSSAVHPEHYCKIILWVLTEGAASGETVAVTAGREMPGFIPTATNPSRPLHSFPFEPGPSCAPCKSPRGPQNTDPT
ncbi:hypothetical protein SKAU_G00313940 [Synaphobranchus kaupii]|uniref:Uncharacterized protein n=1 Tax=Synaphobranchus kaupii TaxID=118154 RepID=A0A9Q1ILM3_SYNKA|nr:hypothetical protein SKAU_G00313940 [Synaphobranchus kaupii]